MIDISSKNNLLDKSADPETPASPDAPAKVLRFHKRTLLLGALLVAAISYVALYVDLIVQQMPMGVLQFAPGAVGAFFILYAGIQIAKRFKLMRWLNAADLLALYLMLFVGVFVCTRGLIEKLIPALTYVNAFASPSNDYKELLFPHLNPALVVGMPSDPPQQHAASGYFSGLPHEALPWAVWAIPCLSWFGLFLLVLISFFCMASLLRKQWAEVDRLPFPQTVLPLEIFDIQTSRSFFASKVTQIGILIPFLIYGVNGFHQSYPTIPEIPLAFENVQSLFTQLPWNNIFPTAIYLSFAAVGFAYLLPTDLLFSLWFFFLLTRVGDVVATTYNLDSPTMPSYPCRAYLGYQAAGAYVALAVTFFYSGRHVLGKAVREGLTFQKSDDDASELLPRRAAVWGLIFAFLGILAWSAWAGISVWLAACVWGIYLFITAVVLTRTVSQAGLLITETSFRPGDLVGIFVSQHSWGAGNLTGISMLNAVFFRDMRGLFLALFLDAQQMADGVGMRRRSLLWPLALAVPIAFAVGVATHLHLAYSHGANALYSYGPAYAGGAYDDAVASIRGAQTPLPSAPAWFAVGIGVVLLLTHLRSEFTGFPLQPLAYAIAPTWSMFVLWFPFFLTWLIKSVLLRYGGQKLYRQARPFFLGLIVGEFSSAALWALLASIFHVMAPRLPLP
ncbi:MAG: DUF6785 family protein [Janthinobacterium lividum]